ncbi:MAG: hypothetical protein HQL40_18970, partial [Alphaproteobacteria bacterium]|nr:hypothetical protein [Alphaproteobacteria bacterium]
MSLLSLRIGARIYAGFGVVLAILTFMAWNGYRQLGTVDGLFASYSAIGENGRRVLGIERDVAGMRRNVLLFADSGDEKTLATVKEMRAGLNTELLAAIAATENPERRQMLERAQALLRAYGEGFDKLAALRIAVGRTPEDGLQG